MRLTQTEYRKLIQLVGTIWSSPWCTNAMRTWILDKIDELRDDMLNHASEESEQSDETTKNNQLAYSTWRFQYWLSAGNMSYAEIEQGIQEGKIQPGDMPWDLNKDD